VTKKRLKDDKTHLLRSTKSGTSIEGDALACVKIGEGSVNYQGIIHLFHLPGGFDSQLYTSQGIQEYSIGRKNVAPTTQDQSMRVKRLNQKERCDSFVGGEKKKKKSRVSLEERLWVQSSGKAGGIGGEKRQEAEKKNEHWWIEGLSTDYSSTSKHQLWSLNGLRGGKPRFVDPMKRKREEADVRVEHRFQRKPGPMIDSKGAVKGEKFREQVKVITSIKGDEGTIDTLIGLKQTMKTEVFTKEGLQDGIKNLGSP